MPWSKEIEEALVKYEQLKEKESFQAHPVIAALETLSAEEQEDAFHVIACFIQKYNNEKSNLPKDSSDPLYLVYRAILSSFEIKSLAEAIGEFDQNDSLFTSDNFNAVREHSDPFNLAYGMCELRKASLSEQSNFNSVVKHSDTIELASVMILLGEYGFLTKNFNSAIVHKEPKSLADGIRILIKESLLLQDNIDILMASKDPAFIAVVLTELKEANIQLTQEDRKQLQSIPSQSQHKKIYEILEILKKATSITLDKDNFRAIMKYNGPWDSVVSAMDTLYRSNCLADSFKLLLQHEFLCTAWAGQFVWNRPDIVLKLKQDVVNQLINYAKEAVPNQDKQENIKKYINGLYDQAPKNSTLFFDDNTVDKKIAATTSTSFQR